MKKPVFAGNSNSQYDPGLIAKEVHDFYGQSIRTSDANSIVKTFFTHLRVSYNGQNNPEEVLYYRGTKSYATNFTTTSAASLGGKYLTVREAPSNILWVIWFNVDGGSTQPVVPGASYIEIALLSSDSAAFVASAITLTVNSLYGDKFTASNYSATVEILTAGLGEVDDSTAETSGFTLSNSPGTQELVQKVEISYVGIDPYFEGALLKGYSYDIYSGRFVKNIEADISNSEILTAVFQEILAVVSGPTATVLTYTAASSKSIKRVDFSGTNIAEYELLIDGMVKAKKRTYFGSSLDGTFDFGALGLAVTSGQIVEVQVNHTRPSLGDFNATLQIT